MLKRVQSWITAAPLLTFFVGLAILVVLFFLFAKPSQPYNVMLLVAAFLMPPAKRCRGRSCQIREARSIPYEQAKEDGPLALFFAVCGIVECGVCILGIRWGWSIHLVMLTMMFWGGSCAVSLGLGRDARHTAASRWAWRLILASFIMVMAAAAADSFHLW